MKNYTNTLAAFLAFNLSWASASSMGPSGAAQNILSNDHMVIKADSSATWVDNLYRTQKNKVEELLFNVEPSLELRAQKADSSQALCLLRYTADFALYTHETQNNIINHRVDGVAQYQAPKTLLQFRAFWAQISDNSEDLYGLATPIDRDSSEVEVMVDHAYSPKTSFMLAPKFQGTEFQSKGFTNHQVYALPVEIRYEIAAKLKLGIGYRYRETTTKRSNIADHFTYVTMLGKLAPKIDGTLRVGVQHRENEATHLSLAFRGDYAATPKMNVILDLLQDSDIGSYGDSLMTKRAALQVRWAYDQHWSVSPGMQFVRTEYIQSRRVDDVLSPTLVGRYDFNRNNSLQLQYTYTDLDSSARSNNYLQNKVVLSATVLF